AERLEREIEITRAAGPILDSLLGVTSEMRDRIGSIEEQLDESMRSLSAFRGSSQIAEFLRAAAHATRDPTKLLPAGVVVEKIPGPPVAGPGGLDIVFGSSLRATVHVNGE